MLHCDNFIHDDIIVKIVNMKQWINIAAWAAAVSAEGNPFQRRPCGYSAPEKVTRKKGKWSGMEVSP